MEVMGASNLLEAHRWQIKYYKYTFAASFVLLTPYLYPMDEKATLEQQIVHCSFVRSLREGKNTLQGITYMET